MLKSTSLANREFLKPMIIKHYIPPYRNKAVLLNSVKYLTCENFLP